MEKKKKFYQEWHATGILRATVGENKLWKCFIFLFIYFFIYWCQLFPPFVSYLAWCDGKL